MSVIMQPAANLHSPTAIGDIAPNTGAFTTLSATGIISGGNGGGTVDISILQIESYALINGANVYFRNDGATINFGSGDDAKLTRFAANTLGLKNSTNAQTFVISRSNDGAGNSSQVNIAASGTTCSFTAAVAGTGWPGGFAGYTFDAAVMIGSGAGSIQFSTNGFITSNGSLFLNNSSGSIVIQQGFLTFSGISSSEAGIKRTGTTLSVRLADDSGDADFLAARFIASNVIRMKGYTVATLPSGTVGDNAYVTDALLPSFLTTIAGGGAVVTPVFYNGSNWVGA